MQVAVMVHSLALLCFLLEGQLSDLQSLQLRSWRLEVSHNFKKSRAETRGLLVLTAGMGFREYLQVLRRPLFSG